MAKNKFGEGGDGSNSEFNPWPGVGVGIICLIVGTVWGDAYPKFIKSLGNPTDVKVEKEISPQSLIIRRSQDASGDIILFEDGVISYTFTEETRLGNSIKVYSKGDQLIVNSNREVFYLDKTTKICVDITEELLNIESNIEAEIRSIEAKLELDPNNTDQLQLLKFHQDLLKTPPISFVRLKQEQTLEIPQPNTSDGNYSESPEGSRGLDTKGFF